ncbi:MAG: Nif3-like dinuclear metal center hexameric protein [Desulfobacteraceae bacterium]|nr:Nif3-like dinuclear metal center hexameric protein [Desulfobacteraceae bacterium]
MVTLRLRDLLASIEAMAPVALAESWDNVGLMAGDPDQEISGILVALDPTEEVLAEAAAAGMNVIVTHHPAIFHPLKAIRADQPGGRFLMMAIREEIAVIGCHTNFDVIPHGVSDILAARLGLVACDPLTGPGPEGCGRIGDLPDGIEGEAFLRRLFAVLDITTVQQAGTLPDRITRAAVCGGSGSALVETAWRRGAQVFVAGEIKHSEARWAEANKFCVIDAGHYATENVAVPALVARLRETVAARGANVPVRSAASQRNPFVHRTVQEVGAVETTQQR